MTEILDDSKEIIKKVWLKNKANSDFVNTIFCRFPINNSGGIVSITPEFVEYTLERFVNPADGLGSYIRGYKTVGRYNGEEVVVDEWFDVVKP